MKYITTQILFSLALTVCTLALFSADTQAANFTVTTTADNGAGSLREAINGANSSTFGEDTINFAIPNCTGNSVCTITLTTGELVINAAGKLTITNSTGASRLLISGNNQSRVFSVSTNADLTLDGVTVTGGNVVGNRSNQSGGGIYINYNGKLTLMNSAVSGNSASNGGGVYNYNSSATTSLTITNSTISGNSAGVGAGISNNYGKATIVNSTISGNIGQTYGGGIYNGYSSSVTLINTTVANNRSDAAVCECAGGIYNYANASSVVNLLNTIVAGNTAVSVSSAPDFFGAVSSSSYSILGNNKLTSGISDGVNGNQVGVNPLLAPLSNAGGGATETHTLLPFSPAIDRGNNCVLYAGSCGNGNPALAGDQRGSGFPRQSGSTVDVGAVEAPQSVGGSFDISGTVFYGTTSGNQQKFVPGVTMSVSGAPEMSTSTNSTGYYTVRNLAAGGSYTIIPSKRDHVNGISSFDATLVLRHVAAGGNGILTDNQRIAADINNSGGVTAFDATQILRFVAAGGSTSSAGDAGNWKFVLSSRSYGSVTSSISGQNYDGILVGDVNGSWVPPTFLAGPEEAEAKLQDNDQFDLMQKPETQVQLSLPDIAMSESNGTIVFPVTLTNYSGTRISSFSFGVAYDPNVLQPAAQAVDLTGVLSNDAGCAVVTDIAQAGRIGIAVSCPTLGISGAETQLNLHFSIGKGRLKADTSAALTFSQTPIFEDSDGQLLPAKPVKVLER
ncbi:MAG TPA: choice-of-anchor Q domain-containing protein [Pyrinomonadaceae bacterium]